MGGRNVFADERRAKVLEMILREGTVRISTLVKIFGVSSETVRRDLTELNRAKKIQKVHGGAMALRHPAREENYEVRVRKHSEEKKQIGRYAAGMIEDGDIVALDSGATTEEIARSVFGLHEVTFLINSLNIAQILAEKQREGDFTGKIIVLGGVLDSPSGHTGGEIARTVLNRFAADKAFLSATSVSARGIMMWDESEGGFSASLAACASEVYVVADSSKIGVESFYRYLELGRVDHLITDDKNAVAEPIRAALRLAGAELHCVAVGPSENTDGKGNAR